MTLARRRLEPPMPIAPGFKYCFKCQSPHPVEAFAIDRKAWDGLRLCCRACDRARWAAYRKRLAT